MSKQLSPKQVAKRGYIIRQLANHEILNALLEKMDAFTHHLSIIGHYVINHMGHDEVILLAKRHNLEPVIETTGYRNYSKPVQDLFSGSTHAGRLRLLTEISLLNEIKVDENHHENGNKLRSIAWIMDIDFLEIGKRVQEEYDGKNRSK
jgi:hypothetical protein